MSNTGSYDREQFEKAGEQAAQVLGRFMSVATEFANQFGHQGDREDDLNAPHKNRASHKSEPSTNRERSGAHEQWTRENSETLRDAGEHLQKMREAAGYTLDSFSRALEKEFSDKNIDTVEVVGRVAAAEAGREALPIDWLNQVSSLLRSGDAARFFEKLQQSYPAPASKDHAKNDDCAPDNSTADSSVYSSAASGRVSRFSAIFEGDAELDSLTEAQFESLLGFVEKSYRDAKELIAKN